MNLKVHHHKHDVFPLIKGILLMLPLLFVLFTSLYVTFNQNAKESYYGETINSTELSTTETLSIDNYYYFDNSNTYKGELPIVHVLKFEKVDGGSTFMSWNEDNIIGFRFTYSGGVYYLYVYFNDNTQGITTLINNSNVNQNIKFRFISETNLDISSYTGFYLISYNNYSFLNNALPYAMSEFNDIGFGKIDFVSLIGDFFIDAFQFNNVYLKFINTYINYFLFVELVLFIPSVLHYVIHWFENLGKDFGIGKEKD